MATISTYFPSLDSDGWIKDSRVVLDKLFSHFLVSDYSQSLIYFGNVASLPYLIYKNVNDFANLKNDIISTLSRYLLRYYEDSDINVIIEEYTDNSINNNNEALGTIFYRIRLSILVKDIDGVEIDLSKAILIKNSKVYKVMEVQ